MVGPGALPLSIGLNETRGLPVGHRLSDYISRVIHRVELFSPRLYSLELSISRSPDLYGRLMALPASDFPDLEEITVDRVSVKIMHGKKVVPWIDAVVSSVLPNVEKFQLKISESRVQPSRPSLSPLPGQVFDTSSCIYAHPFLRDEFFRSLLHHATSPSAV